ncbi:hypothetical protein OSTOST_19471 [Ostertagia ostertagi]
MFLLQEAHFPGRTPLPANLTSTFMDINRRYNPFLEWSNATAQLALEESVTLHSVKNVSLKVTATHEFWDKDNRTLEERVNITLQSRLKYKGQNVTFLPPRSLYGCNGTYYPTQLRMTAITVSCLYIFRLPEL